MRSVFTGDMYNGNRLSRSEKNDQGFYREILQRIYFLLEDMIKRHSCVFLVRFDLRYPDNSASHYPNNNALVSQFIEAFTRYCSRENYDPRYLWVRELSDTGQFHYHFMLLLNGNRIQCGYILISRP